MKPTDFCNWLKGHYDMGGEGQPWSPKQAEMVSRHLDLVFQAGPEAVGQGPQAQFCRWLSGTLEALADAEPGAGVDAKRAGAIGSRLAAVAGAKEEAEPPHMDIPAPKPPHSGFPPRPSNLIRC